MVSTCKSCCYTAFFMLKDPVKFDNVGIVGWSTVAFADGLEVFNCIGGIIGAHFCNVEPKKLCMNCHFCKLGRVNSLCYYWDLLRFLDLSMYVDKR